MHMPPIAGVVLRTNHLDIESVEALIDALKKCQLTRHEWVISGVRAHAV